MIKKTIYVFIIGLTLLFSGCGENQEDYDNAKNPRKFVETTMYNRYKREIVIIEEEKLEDEKMIFEVYFKDEKDKIFQVETYWEVSAAVPTRHYILKDNYKNKY